MVTRGPDLSTRDMNTVLVLILVAILSGQISHAQDCECELADYKNCRRTIDIAVLMQNSTARQALPVIYLAKKDLEEQGLRGPLQNWTISITYKDTKGVDTDAALEALQLHHHVTKQCKPATPWTRHRYGQDGTHCNWTAGHCQTEDNANSTADCAPEQSSPIDLILGPLETYSLSVVSRLASYWKTPLLTTTGVSFERDTLYYIHGDLQQLAISVKNLLEEWNWTQSHIYIENYEKDSIEGRTTCHLVSNAINKEVKNYSTQDLTQYFIDEDYEKNNITTQMESIQGSTRITLLCFERLENLRTVMEQAKTPPYSKEEDYVYIFIDVTAVAVDQPFPTGKSRIDWLELNASTAELYEPLFVITPRPPEPEAHQRYQQLTKRTQALLNDSNEVELMQYLATINDGTSSVHKVDSATPHIASFYDGLWFFLEAFNRTLKDESAYNETSNFTATIFTEMDNGVFNSHLKNESYELLNKTIPVQYSLLNWQKENGTATFKEIAYTETDPYKVGEWKSKNESIYWYGNKYSWRDWRTSRPTDAPKYGFKDEGLEEERKKERKIIIAVLCLVAFALAAVVVGLAHKYHKRRSIERKIWEIKADDIKDGLENPKPSPPLESRFKRNIDHVFRGASKTSIHNISTATQIGCSYVFLPRTDGNTHLKYYKEERVVVKTLKGCRGNLPQKLLVELTEMKKLSHKNVVIFFGASHEAEIIHVVMEFCSKGSFYDLLKLKKINSKNLKYSMLHDLICGLSKLHSSKIKYHGNLKSTNCVVNSRFLLKVTDFGLLSLRPALHNTEAKDSQKSDSALHAGITIPNKTITEKMGFLKTVNKKIQNKRTDNKKMDSENSCLLNGEGRTLDDSEKLWTAPERLSTHAKHLTPELIQRGDIYSFGIILNEVFTGRGPFPLPMDYPRIKARSRSINTIIVESVRTNEEQLRPFIDEKKVPEEVSKLIKRCWEHEAMNRPSLGEVKEEIFKLYRDTGGEKTVKNLPKRMNEYSNALEKTVKEKNEEYLKKKSNYENLLYQLLPQSVTQQLVAGNSVEASHFDNVTIYFSDIVGFTALAAKLQPIDVVKMLNKLYTAFDSCLQSFDVYKVETIGDAYMVVSGMPELNGNNHAREIARMSLALLAEVRRFRVPASGSEPEKQIQIRIGVHSGPCVAGVVGKKMPRYCLFGDTVNTASRMESAGLPMKIHISSSTYDLLQAHHAQFHVEYRGVTLVKDIEMKTYWLNGEKDSTLNNQQSENFSVLLPEKRTDIVRPQNQSMTNNSPRITRQRHKYDDMDLEKGSEESVSLLQSSHFSYKKHASVKFTEESEF